MKWFFLAEESNEWVVSVTTVVDRDYILSFLHYNTTVACNSPTSVCSGVDLLKVGKTTHLVLHEEEDRYPDSDNCIPLNYLMGRRKVDTHISAVSEELCYEQ